MIMIMRASLRRQNKSKSGEAIPVSSPAVNSGYRDPHQSTLLHNFNSIPVYSDSSIKFQPKLAINAPGDKHEQEAEAMADAIMRMPEGFSIQRKCDECEEEEEKKVQRKPLSAGISPVVQSKGEGGITADPLLSNKISTSQGNGNGMDKSEQSFMSNRFGVDFSKVKIHTDNEAALMNHELNAKAFTAGSDIYFNKGEYQPGHEKGRHLLAHELTHVVQQSQSSEIKSGKISGQGEIVQRQIQPAVKEFSARFEDDAKLNDISLGIDELKKGDRGLAVTKLQQALIDLGYLPPSAVDGKFEGGTETALKKFQGDKGISPANGKLDKDTLKELNAIYDTRKPYLDKAKKEPGKPGTHALSVTDKSAAIAAMVPAPKPGAPLTFKDDLGPPKGKYGPRIKAELASIIKSFHKELFEDKKPLRGDPAKNFHDWAVLEAPAKAAKDVVDKVYSSYYGGAAAKPPMTHAGGNLIDQWEDEIATNAGLNATQQKDKARDKVKYLIDSNCDTISGEHSAVPSAATEAGILSPIIEEFVDTPAKVQTLLDLDIGWEGAQLSGTVYLQRYKSTNPDAAKGKEENRIQMWELFHTCIHEYLHTLAHGDFNTWADTFKAHNDNTRYNTLTEGLCDFFTINVRKTVVPTTVQATVEGPYANGNPPPVISPDVYPSHVQAEQMISVVGIKNAQEAYFRGKTKLIGGP
jgi:peptidoglycan hydrolase-like protein with peptidoglycan-binding domain